jgi:hypothetical protein
LNIDGNDDVWVGNMWGRSAALLAGDNTAGHPPGTKAGDVIHIFQSGSIQMVTDVSIDPAGNVWVANNWNKLEAAAFPRPGSPTFRCSKARRIAASRTISFGETSTHAQAGRSG